MFRYEKAAEGGEPAAACNLGALYAEGHDEVGLEQDDAKA
jgi:TPR repeat protein